MTFNPLLGWPMVIVLGVLLVAGCIVLAVLTPARRWRWVARAGVVLLLCAAMARPGVPTQSMAQSAASAVDVFVLVDTTASMVAEDWDGDSPRLDGAKADMESLLDQLPGARVSMISFDSTAAVRVPLTTDHTAFSSAIETIGPEITLYSGGSSITEATSVLVDRLEKAAEQNPENASLVYYFGDGEQTSDTSPESMSAVAGHIDGGAVFGYGTEKGGRMKETLSYYSTIDEAEYIQDTRAGTDAISKIDEGNLSTIAGDLGVDYTHRTAATPFDAVHTAPTFDPVMVDREVPGAIDEYFWIPLIGVFAWIVVELILGMNRIRTLAKLHTTLKAAP